MNYNLETIRKYALLGIAGILGYSTPAQSNPTQTLPDSTDVKPDSAKVALHPNISLSDFVDSTLTIDEEVVFNAGKLDSLIKTITAELDLLDEIDSLNVEREKLIGDKNDRK